MTEEIKPVPLPDGSSVLANQTTDGPTITIMLDGVVLRRILAHWDAERLRIKLSPRDAEVPHD